jgi:hypothetical protein
MELVINGDGGTGGKKPAKGVSVKKLKAVAQAPVIPDVYTTPKGNIITKQQFLDSAKQGLPFNDMKTMGDWLDEWVKKPQSQPIEQPKVIPQVRQDYYEGYSTPGSGNMRYHE